MRYRIYSEKNLTDGCCLFFVSNLMKNSRKQIFSSLLLKFSRPVFFECFLIFASFEPHLLVKLFLI